MNITSPVIALAILAVIAALIGIFIGLGGANDTSESEYRAAAIDILRGERVRTTTPRLEPGLLPGLSMLSEAMYCPESACTHASEMEYLYDVTREMLIILRSDIINPLCRSDELSPPDSSVATHKKICTALENIFEDLRALEQNVKTARDLLARNEDPSSFQAVLNQLNNRMLQNRDDVRSELQALREIEWLKPVFSNGEHAILEIPQSSK